MRVSAHQPAYLPWLGYFDKIARVDVFVYLDTVQFEKNSFINRNRIMTPSGPQWLTIPVRTRGHLSGTLRDTRTDETQAWRTKHLRSIAMNYSRAPHFPVGSGKLEALLNTQEDNLAELCWIQLGFWLAELGITTRLVRGSELQVGGTKADLVLDLCRQLGADHYLSGALGRDYLEPAAFRDAGIELEFQEYVSPVYPQQWGAEFVPNLSIVDYWMNCGPQARPFAGGA